MMTQAFYTGISGLRNSSTAMDILSNNLANINTVGFRGYTTEFSTLFEDAMATSSGFYNTAGAGVKVQASSMILDQGPLAISDRSTDIAIEGKGWFGIQGEGSPIYTRDGTFTFDATDDLVTSDGFHVLGTMGGNISSDGILTQRLDSVALGNVSAQEKLRFPKTLTYPPEPTTNAKFSANIGTAQEGYETVTVGTSVVDPQNNQNHLRLEFTKSATQNPPGTQWDVKATTQSADGATIYDTQTGVVAFDAAGALVSTTLSSINNNGTTVNIDLGTAYDGIVSIDTPVTSGSSTTDGTVGGDLIGYTVNQNAEIIATFTNGMQSSVGRVAIYHFNNEQGLERVSGTRFQESQNSGSAKFYVNAKGENIIGTKVVNYRLENSNVEMAAGLTDLIILQRTFGANSKSITTADEMMKKALSMNA